MRSLSVIQRETSRTVKEASFRAVRFLLLLLWMLVRLRRQRQTKDILTPATAFDVEYKGQKYHFDQNIYANRVFDSKGKADPNVEIQFGPNIKDWPEMSALPENLIVKVVSEIHDPVTTTDELDSVRRDVFVSF